MPSTQLIGTPGPNNDKIGGIPTVHYYDWMSRGRGQVVRLLFIDAGIAFKDVRYGFNEYPTPQIQQLNPIAKVPIVELNDKVLFQSYPILRHFARVLGAYDGVTEDEKFWVDAICDIVIDWRTTFLQAFFNANKDTTYPKHCSTDRPRFLKALNAHLLKSDLSNRGAFVLGDTFTYADVVLYQILHDEELVQEDRKGLIEYERLRVFVDGVEGRENIRNFLGSEKYLG